MTSAQSWSTDFLLPPDAPSTSTSRKRALIVLNQPFSEPLLDRIWHATDWHCFADGGSNRVYDLLAPGASTWAAYLRTLVFGGAYAKLEARLPDLVKGDLDSIRADVRAYYESKGVAVLEDGDLYATDLMKCIKSLEEKEKADGEKEKYDLVLLGGLSGRLDQTVHTLSFLHKLRKSGRRVFALTDDNVGWVLDEGEHSISIPHSVLGPTCGLLPVGVDSTILSTKGLRWNLTDHPSGFDGLVSTSNHLVPEEPVVWIKTSRPIWWCAELKPLES
ncbi:thiamine pyrophosphokinase Thi80 [Auriscalpium vulgare]|uniref:Thiamine pyrophosphokinase Thi80 n=1 Tax=Auriscalpium vulgare TaxID=40419 RepID=A0ACB8S0X8_9AGAM|nr:thiamine pyrophosphokinase Thi80 [Auriscalpium vulgare]